MAALDVLSPEIKSQLVLELTQLVSDDVVPRVLAERETDCFKAKEAVKYLNVSYDTFKRIRSQGLITGFMLKGTSVRRYRKSELDRYLRESEERL
ncbi:MAG: helix-turn-helix domain-containing protein [Liquorilactobacillus nagelii]|uniref:helix-turn-helix domain-containing protein n=1 Tax=Lactobacillaceae TaxID=33958 RepID=UPI0039EB9C85